MEQHQPERLKTLANDSVRYVFARMQHIAPNDRFALLMEHMEWIVNDLEDEEFLWMEERL
tara:strand:- start:361 stop:540 length:180 start_codon:yes stop_codon:yes gene_type:complete